MITVQRARELRAMIEKAAGAGLDNKDGSTAVELFPTLTGGGALVKSGTRINWKGALKRATVDLWDTAENTPEAAPNLWEDVLIWVRLTAPGMYAVCGEADGEGVLIDGTIYHVRGCPILPGKETVTLDYIEQ